MKSYRPVCSRRGMALVLILGVIVLVTIMAVGLSAIMRTERAVARNNLDSVQARAFAEMAVDNATGLIRTAIEAGSMEGKFWSSQGGKITVFNADGSVDSASSRNLFSDSNGSADTVNLNQTSFSGNSPIASVTSGQAPAVNAQWINVLDNPANSAGLNNKVVGRYAFWVDDETSKLNVNTADGIKSPSVWYGSGQPADVNLQALTSGGVNIGQDTVAKIAEGTGMRYSGTSIARALNSPQEIDGLSATAGLFKENSFNLTHYNVAPELNIFGEPKIYLTTTFTTSAGGIDHITNAMLGEYKYNGTGTPGETSDPEGPPQKHIYPTNRQLPALAKTGSALPQSFDYDRSMNRQIFDEGSQDYDLGWRIANYLKGRDSRGNAIKWPTFPGSSAAGFAGKYTDRQIDSITLQILSLMKRGVLTDHFRAGALPYVMGKGWLSGKPVRGISRMPKVNEVVMVFAATEGEETGEDGTAYPVAKLSVEIYIEWYLPKDLEGYPLVAPYDGGGSALWRYGFDKNRYYLNCFDAPVYRKDNNPISFAANASQADPEPWKTRPIGAAPLGGYWMDNLLRIYDQDNLPAGIDLFGHPTSMPDPDQDKAKEFHPWTKKIESGKDVYYGAGPNIGSPSPVFRMNPTIATSGVGWTPGEYHSTANFNAGRSIFFTSKPGVTEFRLSGGVAVWVKSGGSEDDPDKGYNIDPVPLDSIRGPKYTGENVADIRGDLLQAVIPLPPNLSIPVPGRATVHAQVADPWVNSMPGDWITSASPVGSTMQLPAGTAPVSYTSGQNTAATAARGGDAKALWLPKQSVDIPKSQRFPSSGYLQYIRTGMMPDRSVEILPLGQQHGVPYRLLNFSPSTSPSQKTDGGNSYPDWAMLDLFTVPALLQPLGNPAPPYLELTSGGATAGRLNPNPPIFPNGEISRLLPMEAIMKGDQVYIDQSDDPAANPVDEKALSSAIESYLKGLSRPLMMPGEICNVPEVAQYLYQGVPAAARSRNDLVRQVVGNLTTRSNTFTVWAVGQTVRKKTGNIQYGSVEPTDIITGESRMQFLIERYLDLGIDGVPGNTNNPGPDGVVGTPDDPADPQYHPSMNYPLPYKYRVISARQVPN